MTDGNKPKNNTESENEVAAADSALATPLPPYPPVVELLRERLSLEQPHSGHRARLRDSAKSADLSGLSDVELIELLLSFLIPRKDTNVIAHKLIEKYGSVLGVLCAPQTELMDFAHITAQVAAMLPALFCFSASCGTTVKLNNRAEAADFFGIAYLGKLSVGTYAAFLDDGLNVRAIECFSGDGVPLREVLSAACKYACKYVFIARRDLDVFPQTYNIAEDVAALAAMLSDMGATMLDYLIFTDYGYYTVGTPPREPGWYPLYIFVPALRYVSSPDLYGYVAAGGGTLYAGSETAEPLDDFAKQLCAAVKGGPGEN